MLTNPISQADDLEILHVVRDFVDHTFTIDRVRAAADAPSGHDDVAWKQMVDLGWAGISLPSSVGGADLGATVQCIMHRELGARLAPTPFLATTALAVTALARLGAQPLVAHILNEIAEGITSAALVLTPARAWLNSDVVEISASLDGLDWRLDGAADLVVGAAHASVLVVVARTGDGEWGAFLVEGSEDGLHVVRQHAIDSTRSFSSVRMSGVRAQCVSAGPLTVGDLASVTDRLAVYIAAEMIGTATTSLRTTLEYLKTRHQFGRPLGTFQALKHRVADAAVALTTAQELVFMAARLIDSPVDEELSLAAPLALARAGEVARLVTEEGIQLHGAIGFTEELEVGMFYKRVLCDIEIVAAPAEARARLERVRCQS